MAFADADRMNKAIERAVQSRVGMKGGYRTQLLADDVVLDHTYPSLIGLDCGGSGRLVTLDGVAAIAPASGDPAVDGLFRVIVNRSDGAEDLTVEDVDGGSIATISQNELGIFSCDTDDGWVLVFILTGAIS